MVCVSFSCCEGIHASRDGSNSTDREVSVVQYCKTKGTEEQRILGFLLNKDMPVSDDVFSAELGIDINAIKRALMYLEQSGYVKKIGRGYTSVTSSFAEATDMDKDWDHSNL